MIRRFLRVRWPLVVAVAGIALTGSAVALALTRDGARGPEGIVQVGGLRPEDVLRSASTPVLAVDPDDPDRLLLANRIERPDFGCSAFVSSDAGKTWRASVLTLPAVGERCYAPSVGFGKEGRAYLFLSMLAGPGNHPSAGFLYESRDGGAHFGRPRNVLPRSSFQPILATSRTGVLALAALSANEFSSHTNLALGPPPSPVTVRISADGKSFGPARVVHSASRELVGGPAPAIGPNGEVYVLLWDYRDDVFDYHGFPGRYRGRFELVLAVSRDGGRRFREHVVERGVVPSRPFLPYLPPLPALAVDPEQGTLYAAWEDGRSGSSDVLVRNSKNGGKTWSAPRVLYGSTADERTPALATGAAGRVVGLAYSVGGGGRARTVVRVSEDGGETYTAPAALTPTPFDARLLPRVPGKRDQLDLGSRLGLASSPDLALAAWTDTRAGSGDTGKADVLLAPVPGDLPAAQSLTRAPAVTPEEPPQLEKHLVGSCAAGPLVDSRRSAGAVVRSFLSALDRQQPDRAYSYLDRRWKIGGPPAKAPHSYAGFVAGYDSITCLRPGTVDAIGGDRHWKLFDTYSAVRRRSGRDQTLIGRFWTHSDTGRAPWSIMGFWTHELAPGADSVVSRWIAATLEGIAANKLSPPRAARALALVSVAMHEAVRNHKGGGHSDADSAAAAVFAHLFPRGPYLTAARASAPGAAAGARIGRGVIADARRDGSSTAWERSLPAGAGVWRPTPPTFTATPLEPLAGTWRTWNLRSGRQFRPPPPPRQGSALQRRELREVYDVSRRLTGRERRVAARWTDGPGTATPPGHWNRIAIQLVDRERLSLRESARLFAALNTAQADAFIAAWDAKYAYWSERPVTAIRRELDPDWQPYLVTPPFPGYVSGHSTTSGAAAEVLAAFFPEKAGSVRAWAEEAATSRLYAGIHFRSDNERGLELGRRVAQVALSRFG